MAAFRATYSDWKLIKTRQVVQVIFEVPLQDADAAYEVLGGMPKPSTEQWFGIAALDYDLPQQAKESAGVLCSHCGSICLKRSSGFWYCYSCRAYTDEEVA